MIRANAHGDAALLAAFHEWTELVRDALQLEMILVIRVLLNRELLRIGKVAGIDTNLISPQRGLHCGVRAEVYVRDKRHPDAFGLEASANIAERTGIGRRRRGDSHDLASRLDETKRLRHLGVDVSRARGRHRLHANRVGTADADIPDHYLVGLPALVRIRVAAVFPVVGVLFSQHHSLSLNSTPFYRIPVYAQSTEATGNAPAL